MSTVRCHISVSLDGFVAGPNQSPVHPLGEGGERLHEWAFAPSDATSVDSKILDEETGDVGAYIMGRRMFGGGEGSWDESWTGWWGDDPPFHTPVFVLTHHPREPLPMDGGTTFHFVTEGIEAALDQARAAAGERRVMVAGGASAVNQYLGAGLLDELALHIVPVVLGSGERLLEGVGNLALEQVEVRPSPAVTHVSYRLPR